MLNNINKEYSNEQLALSYLLETETTMETKDINFSTPMKEKSDTEMTSNSNSETFSFQSTSGKKKAERLLSKDLLDKKISLVSPESPKKELSKFDTQTEYLLNNFTSKIPNDIFQVKKKLNFDSIPTDTSFKKESSFKNNRFFCRKGDWRCSKCYNYNYSFRDVCNKCNLAKELSDKHNKIISVKLLKILNLVEKD